MATGNAWLILPEIRFPLIVVELFAALMQRSVSLTMAKLPNFPELGTLRNFSLLPLEREYYYGFCCKRYTRKITT